MKKPNVLFLSHLLPYPPDSGAAIRTYNTLRVLAGAFDVTALCFTRASQSGAAGSMDDRVSALREHGTVRAFPIASEGTRARLLLDHLRSTLLRKPYVHYVYESGAFRRTLLETMRSQHFDLVHVDSLDLVSYLPDVAGMPIVCVHHNVESALLRRRALAEQVGWKRAYLTYQANRIEDIEREWCPRVNLNIAVSDQDRDQFEALVPGAKFTVFPNGVDVERYRPESGKDEGLVFVGGTTWFPNLDALEFFSEEVLPLLEARGQTPGIDWVGTATDAQRERFRAVRNLNLTGYVEDERPAMRNAACFIVPLRVGGGTRLKILNAWAMGKAVVSTSIGCEGLEARDGENILIADTPEAFAAAIDRILRDDVLRKRIGAAARKTAEATYSWGVIGERMIRQYQEVMSAASLVRSEGQQQSPSLRAFDSSSLKNRQTHQASL